MRASCSGNREPSHPYHYLAVGFDAYRSQQRRLFRDAWCVIRLTAQWKSTKSDLWPNEATHEANDESRTVAVVMAIALVQSIGRRARGRQSDGLRCGYGRHHGQPFGGFAAADLPAGYVEEERFISGTATSFTKSGEWGIDGRWALTPRRPRLRSRSACWSGVRKTPRGSTASWSSSG